MIELANQTGVNQSTLSRILSGKTLYPHRRSLEILAAFFNISINQLFGKEPIYLLNRLNNIEAHRFTIPLLEWDQMLFWITHETTFKASQIIEIDKRLSVGSFAVVVEDAAMEPQFPCGTVLVVDTKKHAKNGSFIIARLGMFDKVVFRQLSTDGINCYLRALSPEFSQFGMISMTDKDHILGVVLEVRKDYSA